MEFDLDAMFPKGAVEESVRREVLRELLRNTRHKQSRLLVEARCWVILAAVLVTVVTWGFFNGRDSLIWWFLEFFWGIELVVWSWIWTRVEGERDKVDDLIESLGPEVTDA